MCPWGHTGLHADFIWEMCEGPAFEVQFARLLTGLKRELYDFERLNDTDEPHVIAFYCKKGKHRSVAVAYIMWFILTRLNYPVAEPIYYSRDLYVDRRMCHGQCDACDHVAEGKIASLEVALQKWGKA